jgi:hypothetical protein
MVGDGRPVGLNGNIREKARLQTFNLRAVPFRCRGITTNVGIVRLFGKTRTARAEGICVMFQVAGNKIFFDKQNAFFYGSLRILQANFHRQIPFSGEELEAFVNRGPYLSSDHSTLPIHNHFSRKLQGSYYLIPLGSMQVSNEYEDLVADMMREAEQKIPGWILRSKKVKITGKPSFRHKFFWFPKALEIEAVTAGKYYEASKQKQKYSRAPKKMKKMRLAKRPPGPLPDWIPRKKV